MATTINDVHQLQIRNAKNGDFDLNLADESARNQIEDLTEDLGVQTARIDNLLTQGTPTEGNAELIDIRVGADGTIYPTAGDAVRAQIEALENSQGGGLTEEIKQALLQIAEKVVYVDEHGQDYYNDLYDALYPPATLISISAVYTQGGAVYEDDSLDTLKSDLVVTARYDNGTSQTVASEDYTLSGTLTIGTSTITVSYEDKTTTFNVTVSPTLLYSLPSPTTFDGTFAVETGVNLFRGLGDVDWTITGSFVDSWTPEVGVGKHMFGYMNANNMICQNNTGNQFFFFAGSGAHCCVGTVSLGATDIVRKVVLRRRNGEMSVTFDSRVNDVVEQKVAYAASNKTISDYLNSNQFIFVGGLSQTNHSYIGTCNEFSIYKGYLSDDDVTAYLA